MTVWIGDVGLGILCGVLVVSGALKLPDFRSTQATVRAFRLPRVLQSPVVAVLFAFAEVVVGGLPVVCSGGWFVAASWAQTALFALYLGLVLSALLRRDEVACNCFGALSTKPVGYNALIRNGLLFAGSLAVSLGVIGSASLVTRPWRSSLWTS